MIVEGQGMGFWTRVRLPSTPLKTLIKWSFFGCDFKKVIPGIVQGFPANSIYYYFGAME
jgi:hypothetical protein